MNNTAPAATAHGCSRLIGPVRVWMSWSRTSGVNGFETGATLRPHNISTAPISWQMADAATR